MTSGSDQQRRDQLWLLSTEGDAETHLVAEVAIDAPVMRTYSFAVPDQLRDRICPGARVRVPRRGKGLVDGVCVRVSEQAWDQTLRPLAEIVLATGPLTLPLIELGLWVADYYHCPPARALRALAPAAAWSPPRVKAVRYVRSTGKTPERRLTEKQRSLLELLAGDSPLRRCDALRRSGVTASTFNSICARGLIEQFERSESDERGPLEASLLTRDHAAPEDRHVLNADQQRAVDTIETVSGEHSSFQVFLLFGVPGSGKTEVYVRAARSVIAVGRQAIIIVPEIALATHLVDRLAVRFDRVSVLHSRLSTAARVRALRAIRAGRISVVIGTRAAVFAPCPQLGLIVVDEEQESSLKNQAAPRYHARDTAIKRAALESIPIILGTATPALETWQNTATMPHYQLLSLPRRAGNAQSPRVQLVLQPEVGDRGQTLLSPELRRALRVTLELKEQAILLHNRRGYAAHLRCAACGLTVSCERCGSHFVYHRPDQEMKCHMCAARRAVPTGCLDKTCGGRLKRSGMAIQRLEEELAREYPTAGVLRLDSDTMRRRKDYHAALERFARREADFLIGTQMVAKGFDFPGVRLVGVIEADSALALPDFRAAERAFQLVAQVVGRAGRRGGDSLAVVQCAAPSLGMVRQALANDYESFAREELKRRAQLFYPPVSRMVRCLCADPQPGRARQAAERLATNLRRCAGRISAEIQVGDAQPCVIGRQRGLYRFQVVIRAPRDGAAQRLLHDAEVSSQLFVKAARLTIDVDPVDLL